MDRCSKVDGRFSWFKCVRNVIEKAVSTCVIILQDRKVKKIQLHNFKVSSTTVWRYMTNKGWKAVNRKRRRICRHGAEGFGKFIAKDDRSANSRDVKPPRDHVDYLWRDNVQRSSPKNTGRTKTVTTLRLVKCAFRHALTAHTFYTSPPPKCQIT